MRRFLTWALGALLLLALIGLVGVGWYYSGEILNVEHPTESSRTTEVIAVEDGTVTLSKDAESLEPGTWGLDAPEAYAQAGPIRDENDDAVERRANRVDGTLRLGDLVDVDGYAYPQDPAAAFDFPVSEIDIVTPLGEQPAWLAEGRSDRWAVFVHGRGARRNECFRLLAILREEHDYSGLCVSYRNDPDGPQDPSGLYRQGAQEWRDVEPAVQYALDHGAKDLVLAGFSMGGQITANLLRHSALAEDVDAVIWDAPLLDWGPTIALGAKDRGVPSWLVPIGLQASEWRVGVDYADLNQIDHAESFALPILMFHGTADATVPVSVADRFAAAAGDNVRYERVKGAGHVQAWNRDRQRYRNAVAEFLREAF